MREQKPANSDVYLHNLLIITLLANPVNSDKVEMPIQLRQKIAKISIIKFI
jgi:hypothetical protein